ncbi:MAG: hypothetical protein AB8G95_17385 [Anaerolineae bacterium]
MNQNNQQQSMWGRHLMLLALLLTLGGLSFILVSENGFAVFVIGGTAILLAHIAAFGGLFMLGGGGVYKLVSWLWKSSDKKEH